MAPSHIYLLALGIIFLCAITMTGSAGQDPPRRPVIAVEKIISASDLISLDIPALLEEADRKGAALHQRLPEYTYLQTRRTREYNSRGKLIESASTYEAYPVTIMGQHRHIISLISENGVPIPAKELEKERRQAAREMESAERENARTAGNASPANDRYITAGIGLNDAGEGVWIGVSQFLRNCRFSNPQIERYFDRRAITLEFSSCHRSVFAAREKYLLAMKGRVWIDATDKIVARLEASPQNTSLSNDETIVYEQMRLPDGLWVPRRIQLNALGKSRLFNGTDKDMIFDFVQYQHFVTEVKELEQTTMKPRP